MTKAFIRTVLLSILWGISAMGELECNDNGYRDYGTAEKPNHYRAKFACNTPVLRAFCVTIDSRPSSSPVNRFSIEKNNYAHKGYTGGTDFQPASAVCCGIHAPVKNDRAKCRELAAKTEEELEDLLDGGDDGDDGGDDDGDDDGRINPRQSSRIWFSQLAASWDWVNR